MKGIWKKNKNAKECDITWLAWFDGKTLFYFFQVHWYNGSTPMQ